MIAKLARWLQIVVLDEICICPHCGSTDLEVRGFWNHNQRYACKACGAETRM
jgi:transposase-like protein